jgi:hypothetical protein
VGEAGMAALEAKASFFLLLVDGSDRVMRLLAMKPGLASQRHGAQVDGSERMVRVLTTSLLLVGALLLAAIVVALVGRWRRRREAQEDVSPSGQLAQFRSLYEAGTLSKEEFERLRNLLNAQMRQSLGMPMPDKAEPLPREAKPQEQPPENPDTGIKPA